MKRIALTLILFGSLGLAQSLHLDLSGEWRFQAGDDIVYASPGFDDSGWAVYELPRQVMLPLTTCWLRRTVALPAQVPDEPYSITIGTLNEVYEVYINGERIAARGSLNRAEVRIARPETYAIPPGILRAGEPVTLAFRVIRQRGLSFSHMVGSNAIPDLGPYLVTATVSAPGGLKRLSREAHLFGRTPLLAGAAVGSLLALLLILVYLRTQGPKEILLLALLQVASTALRLYEYALVFFDAAGIASGGLVLFGACRFALGRLVSQVFAGRSLPWIDAAGWLMLGLQFLFSVSAAAGGDREGLLFVAARLWQTVFWIVMFAVALSGLWRSWRSSGLWTYASLLQVLVLLMVLLDSQRTAELRIVRAAFSFLGMEWSLYDVWVLVLSIIATLIMLDRLSKDRREKLRLANDAEAAGTIQRLFFTDLAMSLPDLRIEAAYEPAQEAGGDFHYVLDGRLVIVGDVSGKGLKAAMLVSMVIGVLRETTERRPARVLAALNSAAAGKADGGFITCCCARFGGDGSVTVANAGHLAPYIDNEEASVEPGLPLGVVSNTRYTETIFTLKQGSVFTLVSDGVAEAAKASGELFGFERTRLLGGKPAAEIAEAAKTWGQNDDITVVTVRRTGSRAPD